jgi:hypothetical protein
MWLRSTQGPHLSLVRCLLDIRAILHLRLVCSSCLVTQADPSDLPITSSAIVLAVAGILLLAVNKTFPAYFSPVTRGLHYSALPLEDRRQPHASREPSPERSDSDVTTRPRTQRILFVLVIVALCLRLELLRWTLKQIQCTWTGIEVHSAWTRNAIWLMFVGCWTVHTSHLGLLALPEETYQGP